MLLALLYEVFQCQCTPSVGTFSNQVYCMANWYMTLTAHQSMKGLPRWGVLTLVKLSGVYSVGLICVIKCRQSSPPMEWARRLTPLPRALTSSCLCNVSARELIEPVLLPMSGSALTPDEGPQHSPRNRCDDDVGAHFVSKNV